MSMKQNLNSFRDIIAYVNSLENEEQIKEIWKLYENKQYTQQELASRYGVARTTITRIIKKKREDHA